MTVGLASTRRLALGTVQFGLAYGVANLAGQVGRDEAADILDCAWASGIDTLDTAIAYGNSEAQLGQIGVAEWQVVSKIPGVDDSCRDVGGWLRGCVEGSLERLKIQRLCGVLLHRPDQLRGAHGDALYRGLLDVQAAGLVDKIGVSVYGPDELDAVWHRYPFQIVQAPFSVVDRRLETSGWLTRLRQAGTEVHVRSIFLQGLLLMPAGSRPARFDRWQPLWDRWHRWLDENPVSPVRACLSSALARPEIDRVVVGIDGLAHLREILAATAAGLVSPPDNLASEDLDLIQPSRWSGL